MKKTYKIDVDCANCANLMEQAAKKTKGVADANVNFMALKMSVEFEEGADEKAVMKDVFKVCFDHLAYLEQLVSIRTVASTFPIR